ncbi:NAD(P)H-dependent glycerol-3-phosphate dehydrogenase [Kitasatospora brasiliensis]|uniref:NAD(P)H-dependent glycerol-3-phosphate dehydrogenase n=1 Tax=Kitasatospora brasiliensis TaxID=3058040 RepID=UPI00292CC8EA|nr:NAD(P)H-dependent glycerol-3-phosphate dehydrogenase [Kitasatospora sp. K002]
MPRVAVLSAGSWGTAFALVLADAGCDVLLHARRPEIAEDINTRGQNPAYLPGARLPGRVRATTEAAVALAGADVALLSIPSQSLRANLAAWAPLIEPDTLVVSLMKGIELGTGLRMSEVIARSAGIDPDRIAVLSGPNLAREIAARQPAAGVIACTDHDAGRRLQAACHTPHFRPYTHTDVIGCELGGTVKNIVALSVGLATGLGLGGNAKATLMTRGLAETARLGAALGADPGTFAGLAGLSDLTATCLSPLSRNRTFGEHLARGLTVDQASAATGQTAEGAKSAYSVLSLARRLGVEMPITELVVAVLDGQVTLGQAADLLMTRAPKAELSGTRRA